MAFDVQAARKAGYSDAEIADFLGPQRRFDVTQARGAGYSDGEIVDFLLKSEPAPSGGIGTVGGFFRGIPAGAVNLVESAAIGASAVLPESLETPVREGIRSTAEAARRPFAGQPGEEGTVSRRFGESLGSFAPLLPLGALGVAGRLGAMGVGVASGAGEARVRAEEGGATDAERAGATGLGAAVGFTEVLPVFAFLNRLGADGAGVVNILRRAAVTGGQEGLQEAAANVAQNLISKGLYNPEQGVFTDTGEALGYGAGTGALVSALTDLVLGRRSRGTAQEPPAPTEAPAPEGTPPLLPAPEAPPLLPAPEGPAGLLPAPETPTPKDPAAMSVGELYQEEGRLSALPKADLRQPENAARLREVRDLKKQFNISDAEDAVLQVEARKAQEAKDQAFAAQSAFGQAELPEVTPREGFVAPTVVTRDLLVEAGLPEKPRSLQLKQAVKWAEENIVGRSPDEVRAILESPPDIVRNVKALREALRAITTVTPMPFEESAIGRPAATALPEPLGPELGGSEPSVELPSASGPVGGELGAAGAPATPVGAGVGAAELPAAQGTAPEGSEPLALTEPVPAAQALAPFLAPERVTPQAERALEPYVALMNANNAPPDAFPRYLGYDVWNGSTFDRQSGEIKRFGFKPSAEFGISRAQASEAFDALTPEAQAQVVEAAQEINREAQRAAAARTQQIKAEERTRAETPTLDVDSLDLTDAEKEALAEYGMDRRPTVTETPTGRRVEGTRYQQDMDAPGNPLPSSVLAELEAGNLADALNELARSTSDPTYAAVARRLMTLLGNTRVVIVDRLVNPDTGQESYGVASSDGQLIWLSRRIGLNDRTLLHESVHAATEFVIRRDPSDISLAQKAAMKEMSDIWDALLRDPKVQLPGEAKYSFSEFVAEVLTSPQLVNVMKAKPWTVGSAWTSFKKSLLKLLGIKTPTNMSDAAAAALDTIFEAPPLRHDNSKLGKLRQAYYDAIDTSTLTGGVANVNYVRNQPSEQRTKYEQAMVDAEDAFNAEQARANRTSQVAKPELNAKFQLAPNVEAALKALDPVQVRGLRSLLTGAYGTAGGMPGAMNNEAVSAETKFRTLIADKAATVFDKLNDAVTRGMISATESRATQVAFKQAEAKDQLVPEFMRRGGLKRKPIGGWEVTDGPAAPTQAIELVREWGASQGLSLEAAWKYAGRLMESARQYEMREHNARAQPGDPLLPTTRGFPIDMLYAVYKAQPKLLEAKEVLDKVRLDLIDHMVAVGRINRQDAADWKAAAEYIPFDRKTFEGIDVKIRQQKRTGRSLSALGRLPKFVNAAEIERPVGNALENYFSTLGWMMQQTVQTDALNTTLKQLVQIQQATRIGPNPSAIRDRSLAVKGYENGNEIWYKVPTIYHAAAFNANVGPLPKYIDVLGKASRILRTSITALPTFTVAQVPQDIQRAILYSGVKNPAMLTSRVLSNFATLSKHALQGTLYNATRELSERGIVGDVDFRANDPAQSLLEELGYADRKLLGSKKAGTLLHRLNELSRASDIALRKAIYEQTLEETRGDELLALQRAREIINFRSTGASDTLGILPVMLQTIPFFNAYIQGTDVLYRAIRTKGAVSGLAQKEAFKKFYSMAGMVAVGSMAYAFAMAGDEEYENLELEERDKSWVLGGGVSIPVPSEIGMLFKAIPERLVEAYLKHGTPDEKVGMTAITSWFHAAFMEYGGRVIPIPAAAKPVLEAWTGYSFRTGRQLEGMFQKGLDAAFKATDSTSEVAKAVVQTDLAKEISRFTKAVFNVEVSPLIIDNTLNGYFGTTAALTLAVADGVLNPDKADRPLHQMVGLGAYTYNPIGTRRTSEFYKLREKVDSAQNTLNMLAKRDVKQAMEYIEANRSRLLMYKGVSATLDQLEKTRAYKQYLDTSAAAKEMSGEERLKKKQEVQRMEQKLVEWVRSVSKEFDL